MAIVPQPHRPVDLMMQGASTIGQGVGAYMQDKELDKQIHPKLAAYIDRLLAGANPDQLKAEAGADPDLAGIFGSIQRGVPVSPQGMVPDLHPQGGLQAPGAVNPAGGPGPYQPVQPPQSVPQANQQQHSLAQAAVGGPGQINPQSLGAMDVNMRGQTVQGVPGRDALTMMAQPIQGAPQVQADTRPSVSSFMPKPQAPAPAQPQQSGYTRRDLQSISPLLPTIEAGRSREMVAKLGAETKLKTEQSKNLRLALQAKAKEEGLDARMIQAALLATEGMDDKMQIAYFRGLIDLQRSQVGAEATKSAAGIKAAAPKGGEDPDEKELRNLQNSIRALTAVTDWEKQPSLSTQVQEFQRQANALATRLGKPYVEGGSTATKPKPAPQAPPPPTNQSGGATKIRVKVKATGQTGTISPQNFDPKKYERL